MASSPRDLIPRNEDATLADSSVAFALQEVIACWNQAYEAMSRGDLEQVTALLDQADAQLPATGDASNDSPAEAELRSTAATCYGRLQHAMQAGLDGLKGELRQTRHGAKAMRGYAHQESNVGSKLQKSC